MTMQDWQNTRALIVIDVQKGFDDVASWGQRNNPECESNIVALIDVWREQGWPIVYVKHNSTTAGSPLTRGTIGNELKEVIAGAPDLLVNKTVHSAFYGEPDLQSWLDGHGIAGVAITGIQTNMCCETTARMASDLGYDLVFVTDATHTFDVKSDDGAVYGADDIARFTELTLGTDFGRVVTTSHLLGSEFSDAGTVDGESS